MARKYVTVTLTARVSGDSVVLLDVHGKKIASVRASDAVRASDGTISSIETRRKWQHAFAGMMGAINNEHKRLAKTAWEVKTQTWLKSLRWRRNRNNPPAKSLSRCYSPAVRPNWDAAVVALVRQYNSRLNERRLRKSNPWRLWAQTVAGNLRKKAMMRNDFSAQKETQIVRDSEAARKEVGRPEVQVCIDWDRTDSSIVVA
jgi:hypothetical protein